MHSASSPHSADIVEASSAAVGPMNLPRKLNASGGAGAGCGVGATERLGRNAIAAAASNATTATCLPEMDAVPRALCRKVSRVQGQYVDCRDARAGYAEMAKSLLAKKALQPGIAMTEIFSQTMAVIPLAA